MRSQMADLGCATTPVAGQGIIAAVPVTGVIVTTIQSTLSLHNRASARLPPRSLKPLRLSTSPGRYALAAIYSALSWVVSYNQKSLLRSFRQDAAQQKTARLLSGGVY